MYLAAQASAYAAGLEVAYVGELVAERVYRGLARRSVEPIQREKLCRIAEVERLMADGLAPIARRLGIRITEQRLQAPTCTRREQLESMTWDAFVVNAEKSWPPFIEQFRLLENLAPKEDAEVMRLLVAHERALVEFTAIEKRCQASLKSIDPLIKFLRANAYVASSLGTRSSHNF